MTQQTQNRKEIEAQLIAKAQSDETFRQQLIQQPKETLEQELGFTLPEQVQVKVIEETPNTIYIFLPRQMAETEASVELSEETLDEVAGGIQFGGGFNFGGGGIQFGGGGFNFGGSGFNFGGGQSGGSGQKS